MKHADLRILRRIAAFLLVVLSIAGIAACTVPEEVFPPETQTAAISDVLHTTEPTEIGTAAEIELSATSVIVTEAYFLEEGDSEETELVAVSYEEFMNAESDDSVGEDIPVIVPGDNG